jgi:hypothetical protein
LEEFHAMAAVVAEPLLSTRLERVPEAREPERVGRIADPGGLLVVLKLPAAMPVGPTGAAGLIQP